MSQDDVEELKDIEIINRKLKRHQEKMKYRQKHGNSVEKTQIEN